MREIRGRVRLCVRRGEKGIPSIFGNCRAIAAVESNPTIRHLHSARNMQRKQDESQS
jgi:hypothetical protein